MEKPKILVVEDERDVAKVIAINLKLEGMDVVEAHDGPSAITLVESELPDCIVLDIMLPKISGWDIIKHIKADPATSDIPVVMVTAKVGERDQLRGLGAGAVKYITKPFSPLALTEAIKSVLKPQAKEEVARERKEAIERLQLSTLYKISDILISSPALDELLEGIADKLISLFDLPALSVMLSEDEPELYAFRDKGSQPGAGRGVSRSVAARELDSRLQEIYASSRRPIRFRDAPSINPSELFPGLVDTEDGYLFPLFERDRFLGTMAIALKGETVLSADEEELLMAITNQVAAAVVRARLHENLREDEVVHRRLLHQTITAQESERRRLASEMHDSIVQSLVGISYRLQAIEKKVPPEGEELLLGDIKLLEEQLNNNIKEMRSLLLGLRPPMLDDMGLFPALESHLKNFGLKNAIQTSFQPPDNPPQLSRDAQVNLFRIVQEALNNVEKHADASRVTVAVEVTPQKLFLTIRDDGKGFVTQKSRVKPRRLGRASMRERAELLGGKLNITSEPDRGTVVDLEIPLKAILEV